LIAWLKSVWLRLWPGSTRAGGGDPGHGLDPELAEIFFAELAEVTGALRTAASAWRAAPGDPDALKQVRRGFHTLKGSAPLVGAAAIGELCAEIEQLLIRLGEAPAKITPEAIGVIDRAVALLPEFAAAIREGRAAPAPVRGLLAAAKRIA
jgi:chemosensory pili system protein ChpA (sensor histidine kinase/response regulator)